VAIEEIPQSPNGPQLFKQLVNMSSLTAVIVFA